MVDSPLVGYASIFFFASSNFHSHSPSCIETLRKGNINGWPRKTLSFLWMDILYTYRTEIPFRLKLVFILFHLECFRLFVAGRRRQTEEMGSEKELNSPWSNFHDFPRGFIGKIYIRFMNNFWLSLTACVKIFSGMTLASVRFNILYYLQI